LLPLFEELAVLKCSSFLLPLLELQNENIRLSSFLLLLLEEQALLEFEGLIELKTFNLGLKVPLKFKIKFKIKIKNN
jgi:hypothetical protein